MVEHIMKFSECPHCKTQFLHPNEALTQCRHCFRAELVEKSADTAPHIGNLERAIPFSASSETLHTTCRRFTRSVWVRPTDLTVENLLARRVQTFLPHWIIGTRVTGTWQAELGYDYRVISHVERYANNHWRTAEVEKVRIDWEPRAARINLHYDDIRTHALQTLPQITTQIGTFPNGNEIEFAPAMMQSAHLRVPDRHGEQPWQDVVDVLHRNCQRDGVNAGTANHIRTFEWNVEYPDQAWRHQLLPLYTTYYSDDDGNRIPLILHGTTGAIHGIRRGSMQTAKRFAQILGALTLVLLLIVVGLYFTDFVQAFEVFTVFTVLLALLTPSPLLYVWLLNRQSVQSEWVA